MTNEEKAKELAERFVDETRIDGAKHGALWMAEWKDRQFKEYLEKKEAEYESQRCDANGWSEQWMIFHALTCTMRGIINELFPKPKEQDNSDNDE